MAKAPGDRRVSDASMAWLKAPAVAASLATPRRRVVSETSHDDGCRVLHLECGHSCFTRDHAVVEMTPVPAMCAMSKLLVWLVCGVAGWLMLAALAYAGWLLAQVV